MEDEKVIIRNLKEQIQLNKEVCQQKSIIYGWKLVSFVPI